MATTVTETDRVAERSAALWQVVEKLAEKHVNRDRLKAGGSYDVTVAIIGNVDGHETRERFSGALTVDHNTTQAKATPCDQAELVGLLLSALPKKKAAELLADLPRHFAKTGHLPEVPAASVTDAKNLLSQLRSTTDQPRRGSTRYRCEAA